jgi:XRE family transcriptional regulator, regulator of sulfur utilization
LGKAGGIPILAGMPHPTRTALTGFTLLLAAGASFAQTAGAPPAPAIGSGVFPWEQIELKPTKTGARTVVFDGPTATLDHFHCHVSRLNPGENTGALHRHPQEELVVIKEGSLEVNIDGKVQAASTGSMIFFSANENENMRNVGAGPATYYVFQFYTAKTPKG